MATQKTKGKDEATVDAKAGGVAAGGTAGALIGGAAGGPVGAAIGAVVGAVAGGATGAAIDNYETVEPEFRSHWEKGPYKAITKWEEVTPAYRYGYDAAGRDEWHGKSYDEARTHLVKGWKGKAKYEDFEPMVRSAWERRAQTSLASGGEAVVPVVEEELQVGKRKVEKGGVRVETTVTERPVSEQVHLHDEKVTVKRRAVNRPATAADVAFKEGTIEVKETAEEAVVAKRARVIEEVVIGTEGHDHTETVRDTVRKTDVKVTPTKTAAHVVEVQPFESFDADYRKHYTGHFADSGYTYDQFSPAYRYGYNLGSDERYVGDWTVVEPQARTHWESRNAGTWEHFKDAVRHGWESITGKR